MPVFVYKGPDEGFECFPEVPLTVKDNRRYGAMIYKFWFMFFPNAEIDDAGAIAIEDLVDVFSGQMFKEELIVNANQMQSVEYVEVARKFDVAAIQRMAIPWIVSQQEKFSNGGTLRPGKIDYYGISISYFIVNCEYMEEFRFCQKMLNKHILNF